MNLRLLVIEGNTRQARESYPAGGGSIPGESYARLLRALYPGAMTNICAPADGPVVLPMGLEDYDGVAITGSALNIYKGGPEIDRQIELVREVFRAGTPLFGSCWGLQVIVTAAGGIVRKNPKGREIGIARRIRLTSAGEKHNMYQDKPPVFGALTVHLDEAETLPPGAALLASNDMSEVQGIEVRHEKGTAWAVQYHPEYDFKEMAAIAKRLAPIMVSEETIDHAEAALGLAADLEALTLNPHDHDLTWRYGLDVCVTENKMRRLELTNWLEHLVLPVHQARGRG